MPNAPLSAWMPGGDDRYPVGMHLTRQRGELGGRTLNLPPSTNYRHESHSFQLFSPKFRHLTAVVFRQRLFNKTLISERFLFYPGLIRQRESAKTPRCEEVLNRDLARKPHWGRLVGSLVPEAVSARPRPHRPTVPMRLQQLLLSRGRRGRASRSAGPTWPSGVSHAAIGAVSVVTNRNEQSQQVDARMAPPVETETCCRVQRVVQPQASQSPRRSGRRCG